MNTSRTGASSFKAQLFPFPSDMLVFWLMSMLAMLVHSESPMSGLPDTTLRHHVMPYLSLEELLRFSMTSREHAQVVDSMIQQWIPIYNQLLQEQTPTLDTYLLRHFELGLLKGSPQLRTHITKCLFWHWQTLTTRHHFATASVVAPLAQIRPGLIFVPEFWKYGPDGQAVSLSESNRIYSTGPAVDIFKRHWQPALASALVRSGFVPGPFRPQDQSAFVEVFRPELRLVRWTSPFLEQTLERVLHVQPMPSAMEVLQTMRTEMTSAHAKEQARAVFNQCLRQQNKGLVAHAMLRILAAPTSPTIPADVM